MAAPFYVPVSLTFFADGLRWGRCRVQNYDFLPFVFDVMSRNRPDSHTGQAMRLGKDVESLLAVPLFTGYISSKFADQRLIVRPAANPLDHPIQDGSHGSQW